MIEAARTVQLFSGITACVLLVIYNFRRYRHGRRLSWWALLTRLGILAFTAAFVGGVVEVLGLNAPGGPRSFYIAVGLFWFSAGMAGLVVEQHQQIRDRKEDHDHRR